MSLYEISQILEHAFFSTRSFKCDNINYLNHNQKYISLVKVKDFFHYIVILKHDEKYVYYYDPLYINKRKKDKKVFLNKWSYICLEYY